MAETDKLNIDNIIARLLEGKTGRCALLAARKKKGGDGDGDVSFVDSTRVMYDISTRRRVYLAPSSSISSPRSILLDPRSLDDATTPARPRSDPSSLKGTIKHRPESQFC